jgi:16S rRNA (guanine527-N7)-methyltransferase
MKEFSQLFNEAKEIFGVLIEQSEFEMLELFADQMAESNEKYNLTGLRDPVDIRKKLFLDSISCLPAIKGLKKEKAIDVGTGAGFPGLILKILMSKMDITLVDSVGKKTAFLELIVRELELEGVEVIKDRAEELGQDPIKRESYDLVFARALAKMPVMLEYLLPLASVGGYVIAQRGTDSLNEVEENNLLIKRLGGEVEEVIPVIIPELTERYIIKIRKVQSTPEKYPRRVGVPKKNPLQNI